MKVIYIVGYERSGSTILHNILAQSANTLGVGELRHFTKRLEDFRPCACGESIYDCDFWGSLSYELAQKKAVNHTRDKWVLFYPFLKMYFLIFRKREMIYFKKIYNYAWNKSNRSTLVDSSKSLVHLFLLKVVFKFDVRILFIVRNPNGILYSIWKRMKANHGKYKWKSLFLQRLKVDLINLLTLMFIKLMGLYKIVKYEDLMQDTNGELSSLFHYLEVDGKPLISAENEVNLESTHSVDGGPTRHVNGLIKLREDVSWSSDKEFVAVKKGHTFNKYYAS